MRTASSFVMAAVVAIGTLGCALPATVRSGEITHGTVALEAAIPVVAREPQTAVDDDGVRSRSKVAFAPMPLWSVRGRVSGCEIGGTLSLRILAEARCGVLQESEGAPLSIAPSLTAGLSVEPTGPWFRAGIDVSKRFGLLGVMLDGYLSYGPELHYLQRAITRADDPREGPFNSSTASERRELRASVPFGLAFRVVEADDEYHPSWDLVIGATPWWVLRSTILEQKAISYDAEGGLAFTIGMQMR